ncbi:MAG: tRNA(Ile)(2)-agmatinylcytidine synthase [Nitrososphaerota archaeon]|nr:tRNA(Ile)(2)-agmatinylcytidine synthase [Nitrososphaerota archaeon]
MAETLLNVGIDDTDSEVFGCTTYVATKIVSYLDNTSGVKFIDYPLLVRLNPNIPWKTRGNGAVSIRVTVDESKISVEEVKESILKIVRELSDLNNPRSDPAIVFLKSIPEKGDLLHSFYLRVLRSMISPVEALQVAEKIGASYNFLKNSKVGIVGALAATGAVFEDYTYELLSYRIKDNYGKPRRVDRDSIYLMDKVTSESTFNNIDPETGRILITPHGRDPVLFGIRGESPKALYEAFKLIRVEEEIECWCIFKTNQGTDAHFPEEPIEVNKIKKYDSVVVEGTVVEKRVIQGGHVIILMDQGGHRFFCAFYSPTGILRKKASKLEPGDVIRVYGGAKEYSGILTINTEKMVILRLCEKILKIPPSCPKCGRKCKSIGTRQGFICKKCGEKVMDPEVVKLERDLETNRVYLPPERSHRHLTKPLKRYGHEKYMRKEKNGFINPWHFP